MKYIPIIFLTARMDLVNHENIPYKVEGYIEKPFEAEHLKEKIDTTIQNSPNNSINNLELNIKYNQSLFLGTYKKTLETNINGNVVDLQRNQIKLMED